VVGLNDAAIWSDAEEAMAEYRYRGD